MTAVSSSPKKRTEYMGLLTLRRRTTYIYVATSVTNFGAILFTPYMHGAVFCVAVDSWRSGLHSVATVVLPLPPHHPQRAPLLYVKTYQLRTSCNRLGLFQTEHVLFMSPKELREAWISMSAYETSRNCWPESFQWRTVTHILRQKSYTKIGDFHKNWCLHIQ